ncbi:hypothetical protein P3342_011389 [Pyrenophora teres f. teres]|nr:hypothetical protein P3342_011389 [Pyrenophora teres f. teres]
MQDHNWANETQSILRIIGGLSSTAHVQDAADARLCDPTARAMLHGMFAAFSPCMRAVVFDCSIPTFLAFRSFEVSSLQSHLAR